MEYNNREYMMLNVSELASINFEEVLETSADSVRVSNDGLMTFVKWDGHEVPPSIQALQTKQGPYTYAEIMAILATENWTSSI